MAKSSRSPLLLATLVLVALSCGRPEASRLASDTVAVVPVDSLTLDQARDWEGGLFPDPENPEENFALAQDFAIDVQPGEAEDQVLSFVKVVGSSACAGDSGLTKTDYELRDGKGETLARGRFHPLRKVYPLGARPEGRYYFRLSFAGPSACSMSLRFAVVTTAETIAEAIKGL